MFRRRVALGFYRPRKGTAYSNVQFIAHNHVNLIKSFKYQTQKLISNFLLASNDYCHFGVKNTVLVFSSNILLSLHAYTQFTNLLVFTCDCIHSSGFWWHYQVVFFNFTFCDFLVFETDSSLERNWPCVLMFRRIDYTDVTPYTLVASYLSCGDIFSNF